jgi:hypothetical protein
LTLRTFAAIELGFQRSGMTVSSSRQDILEVAIGVALMLPLMILVAWAAISAIDDFVLREPDELLALQASTPNSSQLAPSSSDFSARRHNSKVHRDRLLGELPEAK